MPVYSFVVTWGLWRVFLVDSDCFGICYLDSVQYVIKVVIARARKERKSWKARLGRFLTALFILLWVLGLLYFIG